MSVLRKFVEEVERVAPTNDLQALDVACSALIARLPGEPGSIEPSLARHCLKVLRRHRRFEQLRRVAQAILDDGCVDAQIYRQYAQALIEAGETVPAIGILESILANPDTSFDEWAEAKGVLGRAWKDRAVKARSRRDSIANLFLKNALRNYLEAYLRDRNLLYQGINYVALVSWGRGNDLSPEDQQDALTIAAEILERVETIPEPRRDVWDYAIAGEALIALGMPENATEWFSKYVTHAKIDSFALAGTVRQLSQIWRLAESPQGDSLLAPLRARLLALPGGSFTISNQELAGMAQVERASYEKVLGNVGPKTYSWMKQGFETAQSVALIRRDGRGFGTGFIVRGSDLDVRLGDELLLLTNAHVVSDPPREGAARPEQVTVSFELLNEAGLPLPHQVREIVWQSPPEKHDASVLRLDPAIPEGLKPMQFSRRLPVLDEQEKQRVYIIGHPGGGEISFSYEDNELIDYELHLIDAEEDPSPCRIHYLTPTEQGSSGSPVFNANWRAIGVHHRGGREVARLNGKEGLYAANEGIWIESIRRAMKLDSI